MHAQQSTRNSYGKKYLTQHYLTVCLSLLSLTFIAGMCDRTEPTPPPVAKFTYSPSSNLMAPVTITFYNESTNATDYVWTYGNNQTSTNQNLVLIFSQGGAYTISLKATGLGGTDIYTRTITVTAPTTPPPTTQPTADFTYSPSSNLTAPVKISFTNNSKNASSYGWDFGDGTTSMTTNPIKDFTKAGDYTVKLTATDAQNQKAQKTVVISVKATTVVSPVADWSWSASNLKVTFTNQSKNATSYSWNFNDGTTSTATNPVHDYAKAGTYTVTLTASDGKTQNQNSKLVTISAPATASCDFNEWAKYLKQTKYVFDLKAGCTIGKTLLNIQNTSNVNFAIRICIQDPDGKWGCGLQNVAPGKEYEAWTCGKALGYKAWGMPSSRSRLYGDGKNPCDFPTFP